MQEELREAGDQGSLEPLGKDKQKGEKKDAQSRQRGQGNTCTEVERNNLTGVAQWTEHGLQTKGSQVRFPVRVDAWVEGKVPMGATRKATTH